MREGVYALSCRAVTLQLQPCEDSGQTACLELAELPHFSRETKRADVLKMQSLLAFYKYFQIAKK